MFPLQFSQYEQVRLSASQPRNKRNNFSYIIVLRVIKTLYTNNTIHTIHLIIENIVSIVSIRVYCCFSASYEKQYFSVIVSAFRARIPMPLIYNELRETIIVSDCFPTGIYAIFAVKTCTSNNLFVSLPYMQKIFIFIPLWQHTSKDCR